MEGENQFLMMSYNILEASLGSNTIPWVMTISSEWRERIGIKTLASIRAALKKEYVSHWHKNGNSQEDEKSFGLMRSLWSAQHLDHTTVLPDRCTYVDEFTVSFEERVTGRVITARSMCGMLRHLLGSLLGSQLFAHVIESDKKIFDWKVRGPRVMRRILDVAPSVLALQEFDVRMAHYMDAQPETSFIEAMDSQGYTCVWFLGTSGSGKALFWLNSDWTCDAVSSSQTILPGDSLGNSVHNLDLQEHFHAVDNENKLQVMRKTDRRTLGMARLTHITTGTVVWFLACHLMTTSRDNATKVSFPGEVRAGELAKIKQCVEMFVGVDERVVLAGDFNTNPSETHVFTGGVAQGFDTGFSAVDHQFHWNTCSLRSIFEDQHGWSATTGPLCAATSVNAKRREWIDYIFTDLVSGDKSECQPGSDPLPTLEEPSDHIPIYAKLCLPKL